MSWENSWYNTVIDLIEKWNVALKFFLSKSIRYLESCINLTANLKFSCHQTKADRIKYDHSKIVSSSFKYSFEMSGYYIKIIITIKLMKK